MEQLSIPIRGMHCASCEIVIGDNIKAVPGVARVEVSRKTNTAKIYYDEREPDAKLLVAAVREAGYEVGANGKLPWVSRELADYKNLVIAGVILFVLWVVAKTLGVINFNTDLKPGGLLVALVVGLIAGVSTCMALVGGLVLSLAARHAELHPEATAFQKFRPHLFFNAGRVGGYAVLGGAIGLLGHVVQLGAGFLGLMTVVVGGVMILLGLKLIEIFPALKNKTLSLPPSIGRFFGLKKDMTEYSPRFAVLSGALTFFLPCGFTQAMQIYAVSTGSFYRGALVMGLFALGTAPGLIGIGGLSSIFKGRAGRIFFAIAGLAVILVGWNNLANGARTLSSSIKITSNAVQGSADTNGNNDEQVIYMTQSGSGYAPNNFTVTVGKPVKWIVNSTSPYTCSSTILMPSFGINKTLNSGENVITFTPTAAGTFPFSCSMGMYRGTFMVVGAGTDAKNNLKNIVPAWNTNN